MTVKIAHQGHRDGVRFHPRMAASWAIHISRVWSSHRRPPMSMEQMLDELAQVAEEETCPGCLHDICVWCGAENVREAVMRASSLVLVMPGWPGADDAHSAEKN